MMFTCSKCGKVIIDTPEGKVLVGCEHYEVAPKDDFLSSFNDLFPGLK